MKKVDTDRVVFTATNIHNLNALGRMFFQLRDAVKEIADNQNEIIEELEKNRNPLDAIDDKVVKLLVAKGYDSAEKVDAATDEELLAVKGIGERTLDDVRGAFAAFNT